MNALGLKSALPIQRHLDLYHVGRRLYKGRFPNSKLQTYEKHLLRFKRCGDIPGAECPEAFFSYLNERPDTRIGEVFEHNYWDILSLASLTMEIDQLVRRPQTAWDHYALARCCQATGKNAQAQTHLAYTCRESIPESPWDFDAYIRLVCLLKRERSDQLYSHLNRFVKRYPKNPEALIEMAKYLEHQVKEYQSALDFAEQATQSLKQWNECGPRYAQLLATTNRRVERLKTKVSAL